MTCSPIETTSPLIIPYLLPSMDGIRGFYQPFTYPEHEKAGGKGSNSRPSRCRVFRCHHRRPAFTTSRSQPNKSADKRVRCREIRVPNDLGLFQHESGVVRSGYWPLSGSTFAGAI